MPACAAPGPAAGPQPDRAGAGEAVAALPVPDARAGGHPRPPQGRRRGVRPRAPAGVHRLVVHSQLPPLPAAAPEPQAARGHRLDGRPVLPPRRGRAGLAREAGPARTASAGCSSVTAGADVVRPPLDASSTANRITTTPLICHAEGDSPRMIPANMTAATG